MIVLPTTAMGLELYQLGVQTRVKKDCSTMSVA